MNSCSCLHSATAWRCTAVRFATHLYTCRIPLMCLLSQAISLASCYINRKEQFVDLWKTSNLFRPNFASFLLRKSRQTVPCLWMANTAETSFLSLINGLFRCYSRASILMVQTAVTAVIKRTKHLKRNFTARTLGSWVRAPIEAQMFVHVFSWCDVLCR